MSKAGNFIIGTAIAGGAVAAIYFATKDKKKSSTDTPVAPTDTAGEIIETTTTVTEEEVTYDTAESLPANTESKDTPAVAKSSGVKVNSPTSPFIKYEGAKIWKYETSMEVPFVTSDGAPTPLNFMWGHDVIIDEFTPRLGLASDLDDMGAQYKALGTIVSSALVKDRKGNIKLIKDCLGMRPTESLDVGARTDNNLRERMAILCRKVVEGAFAYWRWRANTLKELNPAFSIYEFGRNNKPLKNREGKFIKKTGAALKAAEDKCKKLYQLTDLDKQRIAANVLWTIVQLYNNHDDTNSLNICIDKIAKWNEISIPVSKADVEVRCSDRYFRAIVDAFFDGCFNCEVPNSTLLYWFQPNNRSNKDENLIKRANPTWLAGVVFHKWDNKNRQST